MGIAALVLGIVSIALCWTTWIGVICGILAIVLGILQINKNKKSGETKGKGQAVAGLVTGIIGFVISAIILIVALVAANKIKKAVTEYDWANELESINWTIDTSDWDFDE